MSTFVFGIIFAALFFLAMRATVRFLRGAGACCGGEELLPPTKKLQAARIGTKVVRLRGMHCERCRRQVEFLLGAIEGAAAEVDLSHQLAVVSMSRRVEDDEIREALEGSGYEVLGIEGGAA